jgi:hypothetical protein
MNIFKLNILEQLLITYIRPIISDRIFLYVLSDKICLYFIMNSYVEKRGM